MFAILIGLSAAAPSVHSAGTVRENERLQSGKITKNEAGHLVLRKFPGARIKKCELTNGRDHSVWVLDIIKAGTQGVSKVRVDGLSGKILP